MSIWVLEDTGKSTIQFDPIKGYRLTKTPSRMACIATNGVVESVGTVSGNNHGFPDRDDFTSQRTAPSRPRFAVFGDSFSAAQFLQVNWPDRCEDLATESGRPVELLNLSIDGGGHTNWWRTLRGFVDANDYEIDGVIFAVYGNDLRRPFAIWDDRVVQEADDGTRTIAFGMVYTFNPNEMPRTLDEARPFLQGLPRWQVHSTATLDRMLRGEIRPRRPFRPFLLQRISHAFSADTGPVEQYSSEDVKNYDSSVPQRMGMWLDIREYLHSHGIPALVVDVPDVDILVQNGEPSAEAIAFSRVVGATFVDGGRAYAGLSQEEIRAQWLRYDGHWGQKGSDRFAEFMLDVLQGWPGPAAAPP
jgi:hypothetical protein